MKQLHSWAKKGYKVILGTERKKMVTYTEELWIFFFKGINIVLNGRGGKFITKKFTANIFVKVLQDTEITFFLKWNALESKGLAQY